MGTRPEDSSTPFTDQELARLIGIKGSSIYGDGAVLSDYEIAIGKKGTDKQDTTTELPIISPLVCDRLREKLNLHLSERELMGLIYESRGMSAHPIDRLHELARGSWSYLQRYQELEGLFYALHNPIKDAIKATSLDAPAKMALEPYIEYGAGLMLKAVGTIMIDRFGYADYSLLKGNSSVAVGIFSTWLTLNNPLSIAEGTRIEFRIPTYQSSMQSVVDELTQTINLSQPIKSIHARALRSGVWLAYKVMGSSWQQVLEHRDPPHLKAT